MKKQGRELPRSPYGQGALSSKSSKVAYGKKHVPRVGPVLETAVQHVEHKTTTVQHGFGASYDDYGYDVVIAT